MCRRACKWQHCALLAVLMLALGCGDGRVKLPTALVAGTVTYRGKPLTTGRVLFFHTSGQAAGADLAADGSFKLDAFQGKNQVAIECVEPEPPTAQPRGRAALTPPTSLIPDRYANYSTSGLTIDVKPGETNKANFDLKD
jgi:hypothetical protein